MGKGFFSRFGKKSKNDGSESQSSTEDDVSVLFKVGDTEVTSALSPNESYKFRSDYIEVDDYVMCICSFFNDQGAARHFPAFWGIYLIPHVDDDDVTITILDQVTSMSDSWVKSKKSNAQRISENNVREQSKVGDSDDVYRASLAQEDLKEISREIMGGAKYLNIHKRIMIKAPDIETMDAVIIGIKELYVDRGFQSIRIAPFYGNQRKELKTLYAGNFNKLGSGFYMTSAEYAGSHSLVTHGFEDRNGEYIGYMVGDVNTSAMLFDMNNFNRSVVIANADTDSDRRRKFNLSYKPRYSDEWCSKISQSALISGHRVVHIVLNSAKLEDLGPKFEDISYVVNLTGDLNMFEMFGRTEDELDIYPAHLSKLIRMMEILGNPPESDLANMRYALNKVLTDFYIGQNMWYHTAKNNRDKIRIVGLDHKTVPKLDIFVAYLESKLDEVKKGNDTDEIRAVKSLRSIFEEILTNNGDLFNSYTSPSIDGAKSGMRTIYDFSSILRRSTGGRVAMAQLINVLGYAVGNLSDEDVIIFHGFDNISTSPVVREYVDEVLSNFMADGGRVVYSYDKIEPAVSKKSMASLTKSDYLVLGRMTHDEVNEFEDRIGSSLPNGLKSGFAANFSEFCCIRRGFDNVMFRQDLNLDINNKYK